MSEIANFTQGHNRYRMRCLHLLSLRGYALEGKSPPAFPHRRSSLVGTQGMGFLCHSYCHPRAIECCQCKAVKSLVVAGRKVAEQAKGHGFPESQPLETV
jgi:hypothetical protein